MTETFVTLVTGVSVVLALYLASLNVKDFLDRRSFLSIIIGILYTSIAGFLAYSIYILWR